MKTRWSICDIHVRRLVGFNYDHESMQAREAEQSVSASLRPSFMKKHSFSNNANGFHHLLNFPSKDEIIGVLRLNSAAHNDLIYN